VSLRIRAQGDRTAEDLVNSARVQLADPRSPLVSTYGAQASSVVVTREDPAPASQQDTTMYIALGTTAGVLIIVAIVAGFAVVRARRALIAPDTVMEAAQVKDVAAFDTEGKNIDADEEADAEEVDDIDMPVFSPAASFRRSQSTASAAEAPKSTTPSSVHIDDSDEEEPEAAANPVVSLSPIFGARIEKLSSFSAQASFRTARSHATIHSGVDADEDDDAAPF